MIYRYLNFRFIAGCLFTAIALMSCNSNSSSDKISDTATMPAYTSNDTVSMVPSSTDSSAMAMPADTSVMHSSKPAAASSSKKKGMASVTFTPMPKDHKIQVDKSGVYEYSEVMPAYPGGQSAIENYITSNIEYPESALDDSKEGRIIVAFTVDENGKIMNAHSVSTKLGDGLDEEAVRVVANMPKRKPGTVKNKPIKARITLPITFMIQE